MYFLRLKQEANHLFLVSFCLHMVVGFTFSKHVPNAVVKTSLIIQSTGYVVGYFSCISTNKF